MIAKNYKDKILDINFGTVIEGEFINQPSYVMMADIKEVQIDGKWVKNKGFDLEKVKKQKLNNVEGQILELSMRLDKATALNLETQKLDLSEKLKVLNFEKSEVNSL